MPEIVDTLLQGAKDGNVPQLKAILQLAGLERAEPDRERRGKGLEQILMEQWDRECASGKYDEQTREPLRPPQDGGA